jgi:YHS domain-containing protein
LVLLFSPLIIIRGKDNNIANSLEVKTLVMPKDPVCGVILDENTSKFKITYEGETYHFCSLKCKKRFKRHAAKFVK